MRLDITFSTLLHINLTCYIRYAVRPKNIKTSVQLRLDSKPNVSLRTSNAVKLWNSNALQCTRIRFTMESQTWQDICTVTIFTENDFSHLTGLSKMHHCKSSLFTYFLFYRILCSYEIVES